MAETRPDSRYAGRGAGAYPRGPKTTAVETSNGQTEVGRSVFVGNLSYKTSWQDLKDHMKQAGEVKFADLFLAKDGRPAGSGIVEYFSSEVAAIAIEKLNNTEIDGRVIFVREDREDVVLGGSGRGGRTQRMAEKSGVIMGDRRRPGAMVGDSVMPVDPRTYESWYRAWERSGGRERAELETTLVGMSGTMSRLGGPGGRGGRPYGGPAGPGGEKTKVFVGNLPFHTSWQDIKDLFRASGYDGIHVAINEDQEGKSKGSAIVTFDYPQQASKAILQFNNADFQGRPMSVHYDKFA